MTTFRRKPQTTAESQKKERTKVEKINRDRGLVKSPMDCREIFGLVKSEIPCRQNICRRNSSANKLEVPKQAAEILTNNSQWRPVKIWECGATTGRTIAA